VKNNYTPEVRFPGFTGEWEPSKLDSIVDRVKSYSLSRDAETSEYTGYKYIHYGDIHTKVADIIDESSNLPNIEAGNYELLEKGDLVLADASEDYQGIATPAVITIDIPYKLVSGLHTIALRPKQVDSLFLYYLIHSPTFRKYGYKTGTGMKVFGISVTNLLNFEGMYPSLEEQTKISNFLKQLDDTIALHQQELTILKQTKQGFLQKMFPKEGQKVPEARFPGFTDDWEQRKLDKILKERKVKQKISKEVPLLAFAAGQGVIDRSERKTNNRDFLTKDSTKKTYLLTKYDDIVYNPSNLKYGAIDRNKHGQGVISPIYVTFETDEIPSFIELIVKSENFKQRALQYEEGTVTKRQSVKPENLLCLNVLLPNSKEEQMKIGNFFKQLDETIALHQCELDALKETKIVFLQKMFV
jgi:type I restriction enzyme, S subunit